MYRQGSCRGYIIKFYYNAASGFCERFVYGGCDGNGNRFDSAEECKAKCGDEVTTRPQPRPTYRPRVTDSNVIPTGGNIVIALA